MLKPHISVLPQEVLESFDDCNCKCFVDGTLGAGGHSRLILEKHDEIEKLIGIDQDLSAIEIAKQHLSPWLSKVCFVHSNFRHIENVVKNQGKENVDGILLDLGVSSMQLDRQERGFSFMREGPLDMRMDTTQETSAYDIINFWPEEELGRIFRDFGEEKKWRLAARVIVEARNDNDIKTTTQLANILNPFFKWNPKKKINPLTLLFQGLRIAVNDEIGLLEQALTKAIALLAPKGRLAVISFHSLEDRIVKNIFRNEASDKVEGSGIGGIFLDKTPTVKLITRKAIVPSAEEMAINPRARSAKLRVIEKL